MASYEDSQSSISVGAFKGYTGSDLNRFNIPLIVLTTLFLALRVYVRGFMTKTFGLEDWLIIPAYVLFMAMCICGIVIGQWLLREDAKERYHRIIEASFSGALHTFKTLIEILVQLTVGSGILYLVDQIFIKWSVAAYFYRICEGWQRYAIVGSVTIFTLFNLAFMFVSTFQCGVPTVLNLVTASITGDCISWSRIVKPLLYVEVALNTACDWIFVLACLPVLLKLRRMPLSEMMCVCFLIFLATGASVLSLVRIKYLPVGGTEVLLLKNNRIFAVLSFTEAGTDIVTVCMATLHPLFQAFVRKRGTSKYPAINSPKKHNTEETLSEDKDESKRSEPNSEEMSTEHTKIGRLGVIPTICDTEMGTITEHNSPRHYTNGWNG